MGDIDCKVVVQYMIKLDIGQGECIVYQIVIFGEMCFGNCQFLFQGCYCCGDGLWILFGGRCVYYVLEYWCCKVEGDILF